MHVIRTESDLQALEDPDLLALIRLRIADTAEYVDHFSELVTFVVIGPGDSLELVTSALGFPVMANRFDGIAFGKPGFTPSWDVVAEHAGWFELVYVLSDAGDVVTVFVSKTSGTPAEVLAMCRRYAVTEVSP